MKAIMSGIIVLFLLSSCSSKKGSGGLFSFGSSPDDMSPQQTQAKELIAEDLKVVNNEQYGISDDELAMLKSEGLLSQEELNSLKIVK